MSRWAGLLIVLYGTAHTVGALVEAAPGRADEWFGGSLWGEGYVPMSDAMSAYWFSMASFGPPLVLVGALVLWLVRRGVPPPTFLAWAMLAWAALGGVVLGPGYGQDLVLVAACALLLVDARRRRAARRLSA